MKPDTYMPIVIGDYHRDTMHLACSEHGAYLLLIMSYWCTGPLPDDDRKLANITRNSVEEWQAIRPTVAPFFSIGDGVWRHKRIEQELARARQKMQQNEARAKAAAHARWNAPSNAPSMPQALLEECPSSSSSSLDSSERESSTIPASRVSRSPAAPLPADWKADGDYASKLGLAPHEVDREAVKFRAYWTEGKGSGSRKTPKGWRQAWMNWVGKAVDRGFVGGDAASAVPPATQPRAVSDLEAQWTARLSRYKPGGFWPSQWGNRPEHGNREIPQAALDAWRASHNRGI